MLSSETRFQMNDAEVTATVIDGEAIMINLGSGVYYSTDAVGARIWELASAGANLPEIANIIAIEYATSEEKTKEDASAILSEFVTEKLLVPHDYASVPAPVVSDASQGAYAKPHLEVYREIGHLLALDPPMPGLENIAWDVSSHN